ncbi:hypothetical protein J5N97_016762 [Dioscorea zingiberensis]|uniref:Large ribosomal subunit protein bL28m n=1 Tax=Dioscorea zingiberensis TaxID=325984 RepID=A0A9D5CKH1_9LILI|nr:hypothetical protein J5N97_016762 [Dioscorea zingiberensis]
MAFRSQELYKKIAKKVGEGSVPKEVMESVKRSLPNNKLVMGRAKRGIYAGRHIQFGNKVSEDGGNKSRRTWKPNVQEKRLFSYIHDRTSEVKVTTHALRCIDKAGGIDEYLLNTPYHKMQTEMGLFWKAKIEKRCMRNLETWTYASSLLKRRLRSKRGLKSSSLPRRKLEGKPEELRPNRNRPKVPLPVMNRHQKLNKLKKEPHQDDETSFDQYLSVWCQTVLPMMLLIV